MYERHSKSSRNKVFIAVPVQLKNIKQLTTTILWMKNISYSNCEYKEEKAFGKMDTAHIIIETKPAKDGNLSRESRSC